MSHARADDLNRALEHPGWRAVWNEQSNVWHMTHESGVAFDVAESEVPTDQEFVLGVLAVLARKRAERHAATIPQTDPMTQP